MDEGRQGVVVDDVVGEEAPAGWRAEEGVGFRRGFSRPRCTNGWADGMAVGTMASRRACPKYGVSYESTPIDLS